MHVKRFSKISLWSGIAFVTFALSGCFLSTPTYFFVILHLHGILFGSGRHLTLRNGILLLYLSQLSAQDEVAEPMTLGLLGGLHGMTGTPINVDECCYPSQKSC